jgi:hypothetical protein
VNAGNALAKQSCQGIAGAARRERDDDLIVLAACELVAGPAIARAEAKAVASATTRALMYEN